MSAAASKTASSLFQTALPLALISALGIGIAHQAGFFAAAPSAAALYQPQTVVIPPHTFQYRTDGEYVRGVHPIDAPKSTVTRTDALTIMKFQVTLSEYDACVMEGACAPAAHPSTSDTNLPVTGVNYDDAQAYARWLSEKTGEYWALPSDQDLAFAAGKSFPDDASGLDPDNKNPALKWIADYEREAASRSKRNPAPQPIGSFGENEFGLADFGGNVWEWTSTCHRRVNLYDNGTQKGVETICGVNVAVGPHRSPTSSFIRDPRGGGCSVGTPPDNLGFRLVKSTAWYAPVLQMLRAKGLAG
ncbi:NirV periplasmic nitrate reductase [Pseudorhizobium banfieldiae]|uniref:NirV periplasmic nitrate reductase n=1 Tax=Pseudorhizobium banfieldiae TaxID=1125847 RepID=L0NKM6_9HYPH|nr:SUMF1/EgtB/PvdO family nonheme iron enzyme [Pseudorhizobium banfieldiae]CAD6620363.1 nitrate reductase [arsenite-oxidising bacterium NT-25]CCF21376.1 NirV periplasmic nitrate reductase [Pseudorhizobium banfieldiae]